MPVNGTHLILDACCVLNFGASGSFVPILQALPAQVVVTQVVRERELLSLRRLTDANHDAANQFEAAIEQGLLLVEDFANDREAETFVDYASVLGDDGESATCAIAVHRQWAIATDDRQAINFFSTRSTAPADPIEPRNHQALVGGVDYHFSRTAQCSAEYPYPRPLCPPQKPSAPVLVARRDGISKHAAA